MHIPSLVKIHWCLLKLSSRNENGQKDGRTTDGQMDGHTDDQRETIIPHQYCVAGYKKRVLLNMTCLLVLIYQILRPYQILSKYFKPYTHEFGLEIHSGEVTRKQPQQRLSFLHATCLLVLIYASRKYYQNISNYYEVIEYTRMWLRNLFSGVYKEKNKARIVLLACDTPTWPDICPTKILSNYLRQYGSYSLHNILASGEINI